MICGQVKASKYNQMLYSWLDFKSETHTHRRTGMHYTTTNQEVNHQHQQQHCSTHGSSST